jgi:hypothetical protein
MSNGKQGISQPAVALAYAAASLTVTTYAPNVAGCSLIKDNSGVFTLTFDDPMEAGTYVAVATAVDNTGATGVSVKITGIGNNQISFECLTDAHGAIDCGIMIAVFPIPVTH